MSKKKIENKSRNIVSVWLFDDYGMFVEIIDEVMIKVNAIEITPRTPDTYLLKFESKDLPVYLFLNHLMTNTQKKASKTGLLDVNDCGFRLTQNIIRENKVKKTYKSFIVGCIELKAINFTHNPEQFKVWVKDNATVIDLDLARIE